MNERNNGIYLSDCLTFLERITPEQVTLAYVDPPTLSSNSQMSITDLRKRDNGEGQKNVDSQEADNILEEHLMFITRVLQQIRRVLNHQGNLFFQSEHRLAGDYKQILDQVFGREHFRSEIIWPNRKNATQTKGLRTDHHTIFHYSKTNAPVYNQPFKQPDSTSFYPQRDNYDYYRFESLLTSNAAKPHQQFEWKGFTPPPGKCSGSEILDTEETNLRRSTMFKRRKLEHDHASQLYAGI